MNNSEILVHNPIAPMYNSCLRNDSERSVECSSLEVSFNKETKKMHSEIAVESALICCDIKENGDQTINKPLDENEEIKTIDLPCSIESPIANCNCALGSSKLQYSTFNCSFHLGEESSDTMQQSETLNHIVELIDDKTLQEGTSTIPCSSNHNQENGILAPVLIDGDENTTQLRFSPCNFSNGYDQNEELVELNNISIESNLIGSSPDSTFDLFNEISCFPPYNETLPVHSSILSSSSDLNLSDTDKEQCKSLNSNFSFMKAKSVSARVEEHIKDSGFTSTQDLAKPPNATSPYENDTVSKLPMFGRKTSVPCRKRPHSCISKTNGSKKTKLDTKRKVTFKGVTIFYFQRKQSFVSVPSQGGSTLGMSLQHMHSKQLSLDQHKRSILRYRKRVVKERQQQQRLVEKLRELKEAHPDMEANQLMLMVSDSDQEEEISDLSSDEYCEEDNSVHDVSEDEDDLYFLQPISAKKRRILLRMAGVQKIDSDEKFKNKMTRESREICGCDCEGECLPSQCQCALAGIPCQVDRQSFPCGCLVSGCRNVNGRVEFDADRVRSHYFQTMRRLRLEETGCLPENSMETVNRPQPQKSPYVLSAIQEATDIKSSTAACALTANPEPEELQENGLRSTLATDVPLTAQKTWLTANHNISVAHVSQPSLKSPVSMNRSYAESHRSCENVVGSFPGDVTANLLNPGLASSSQDDCSILKTPYLNTASSEQHFLTSFVNTFSNINSTFSPMNVSSSLGHTATGLKQTLKLDPIASLLPTYNSPPKHAASSAYDFPPPTSYLGASGHVASLSSAATLTSSPETGYHGHDWKSLNHVTSASLNF